MLGVSIVAVVELRSSPALPGVDWHGLLSLLGRTLPAKMPHLATRETFLFVESFPLGLISLFLFSLGEAPPEEVFSKEQALYIVHTSALKAPSFQKTLYLSQP